jgi:putative transposase
VDYIHYNPVKHGFVKRPVEWPFSSIHRYIKNEVIAENWACGYEFEKGGFGEV